MDGRATVEDLGENLRTALIKWGSTLEESMTLVAQEVINIKRAFHCPQAQAERLVNCDHIRYRMILMLGPMRVHWCKNSGWMLDNRRARLEDIEDEAYRVSAERIRNGKQGLQPPWPKGYPRPTA